jgi:hypothetical protein
MYADTGFVATDVGKLARKTDDNTLWMLTATTPTWQAQSGAGGSTGGSGTLGKLPRWTGGSTLGDSHLADDGTVITAGLKIVASGGLRVPTGAASGALAQSDGSGNVAWATIKSQTVFTVEGTLATSTGALRIYNSTGRTLTFSKVFLSAATAPTGSALIVDVNKGGTTIFTTQANRPQVAATANTGSTTTFDVTTWADGEYLTVDVDQVGSTVAGANLTIHIVTY